MKNDVTVVIPTIGRPALHRLLSALHADDGPQPDSVIVVDDRPASRADPLPLPLAADVTVLRSGGRGPAAARNTGWRAATTSWVCFVDDDVALTSGWCAALAADLAAAEEACAAGSQATLEVLGGPSIPTDDERRTHRLADARWITADMAYRRDALVAVGGFDERFPRAFREDSDLALRVVRTGRTIVEGGRRCIHPVAPATLLSSVRAQRGNADNALLRRKFGFRWRTLIGEGPGRMPAHIVTTAAGVCALLTGALRCRRVGSVAAVSWLMLTGQFTWSRFRAGPLSVDQLWRLAITSAMIPPTAVWHRLVGEWRFRNAAVEPPLAVLFDRDDTLIADGPYLNDPVGVRPLPGVGEALQRLRSRGLRTAVISNQSGVARGLITQEQLAAVNAAVDAVLGPFDSWQVCVHAEDDGCACRKPKPGMVLAAAEELGVPPHRCVMIGDIGADVDAARAAGAAAVLVPTTRTRSSEIARAQADDQLARTLPEAVDMVLRDCR